MKKRVTAFFLVIVMLVSGIPAQAYAYMVPESGLNTASDSTAGKNGEKGAVAKPASVETRDDGVVKVEDSWEETYPYGAFLFDNSEAKIAEGGDEAKISLYRLGGTAGRATAYLAYSPVVAMLKGEIPAYGTAAGSDDVDIMVEDVLPIAEYQETGKDPDPEPSDVKIGDEEYTGKECLEGDRVLTLSEEADSYQWYIYADDRWQIVENAENADFVVSGELYETSDFRCVFTRDGNRFCTDSLKGKAYKKSESESLPEMPDDLDLNPEQSFSPLDMDEGDPYETCLFAMTFADGEWVKEISVKAPENDKANPLRFGTFTILDHKGGDIFQKASTVTLEITDNDVDEPYTIGFTNKEIAADKSDGKVVVTLKREGGGQDPITVDYSTEDKTAVSGQDYKSVSGQAVFYADVDEVTIEVPLINDGEKNDDPKTFLVKLGEVKGDSKGLCTLKGTEAEVSLTNSNTGRPDGSTSFIFSEGESELQDDEPITGTQKITPDDELIHGEISGYDDPADLSSVGSDGEEGLDPASTYNYGMITFTKKGGGSYWNDRAYVAGASKNDIAGWRSGSAYGSGWQLKSDNDAYAVLKIDKMAQMYSDFYGEYSYNAGLDNGWHFSNGYAYGWATIRKKDGNALVYISANPKLTTSALGMKRHLSWSAGGTISRSWGMSDNVEGLALGISKHKNKSKDDVYSRIDKGYLKRRTFNSNLRLRIHTANDGESGNGNVVTAPAGGAALREGSGVYKSMKPDVLLEERNGGVDNLGKLYVGSKIRINLRSTDSYKPYTGSELSAAAYVTRSDGSIVKVKSEPGKDGSYYITMFWDGMTSGDLNDTYTINVVMTRRQKIELNLRPSVARKTNRDGSKSDDIDPDKIGEAWDLFWKSGGDYITLGCSQTTSTAPHFDGKKIREVKINKSDWASGDKNPLKILGSYDDIQYINFNRDKDDRITFNGKIYKGNDRINMTVEALAFPKLSFGYYNATYTNAASIMHASVNRVELYLDGNGDGKISGKYDKNTGYFVPDPASKDVFMNYLEEGGSYDEVSFQPEKLDNGSFGEYFAKVYYTMTPRALVKPEKAGYAQVLPAFTTSRTDDEKRAQLTEEQNSYRYILSGKDSEGLRTSDYRPMYGEEATGFQYVDVPLGGDRSPLIEVKKDVYEWKPQYVGNLIYPFSNPEPIFIEHSLAGDNFPLAKFDYGAGGKVTPDKDGKAVLNGYLGSFVADTTIALCVTEQHQTSDELHADPASNKFLRPESSALSRRSASPNGAWLTKVDSGDMGSAGFDTSKSGQSYSEFDMDYNSNLPVTQESFQGLATVVTGKNTISILISLPLAGFVKSNDNPTKGRVFPETVTDPMGKSKDQIKGYMDCLKTDGYGTLLDSLEKSGYKKSADGGKLTSKKFSGTISFSMVFTLKYDTRDNTWYLQEFLFGAAGSLAFRYEVRLTVCPVVYGYVAVNASLSITTGGTIIRKAEEGAKPFVTPERTLKLKKGEKMEVPTAYINMYIRFNGKIYMDVLDSKGASTPSAGTRKGYLKSGGGDKIQIQFKSDSGMSFDPQKTTRYVRIVALENTTITYLNTIESIHSDLTWSGVKLSPKIVVEAGVGAGVEGLKVEAFVKLLISANFVFGQPQEDGTRKGATVDNATFGLSLALRSVLLMTSWEIDAVGIKAVYDGKTDKWAVKYTLLGKDHPLSAAAGAGGDDDQYLKLPVDVSVTQSIYSDQIETENAVPSQPEGADTLDPAMAYDPEDPNVPFQLSGYNSSVEAFRLSDGLDLGYDYRVVSVNDENYVVFTMGRPGGKGMDTSMLAVSRLVLTGQGYGKDSSDGGSGDASQGDSVNGLGLVNPLDWDIIKDENGKEHKVVKAPKERSALPYILVDTKKDSSGKLVDDGTGDLDFDVKVINGKVRVAWVSYKEPVPVPDPDHRTAFRNAVKNTVVKQADYSVSEKTGFTEASVLSAPEDVTGHYLPTIISAKHTAYVKANSLSDAKRKELVDSFIAKQNKLGYFADKGEDAKRDVYRYRLTAFENNLDFKGDSSTICIYAFNSGTVQPLTEFGTLGGSRKNKSNKPIPPIDKMVPMTDESYARSFCLSFTTWEDDLNLETGDRHISALYSGEYIQYFNEKPSCDYGQKKVTSTLLNEEAYIETLQVARMGTESSEKDTMFVGQGGKVYLADLQNLEYFIKNNSAGGTAPLTPTSFFGDKGDTDRTGFALGRDGDGNLAMVYVSMVKNTTNNGLYLSTLDNKSKVWGRGVLLAMRYMDVHEEAIRKGWSDEDERKAYLGQLEGYGRGGMDQFQFRNPQIAMGSKADVSKGEASDLTKNNTTLVVLTQGMMRYLTSETVEGETFLTPSAEVPAGAKYKAGLGVYAISYGKGNQSIGDAKLKFTNEQFTAGSDLTASLSFINTGDVSIRGSEDNPITVTLSVMSDNIPYTQLAEWEIKKNIETGYETALSGSFTLPTTLDAGAGFSVTVNEDESYAENACSATVRDIFTVRSLPELGFEEESVVLSERDNGILTLDEKGNTVLSVDMFVGNRGVKDAENVYLQFAHGIHDPSIAARVKEIKGEDSDWNDVIYNALDISGNDLEVGEEEMLSALSALDDAGAGNDFKHGIINLGTIRAGYGRHVRGTITVPADCFTVFGENGSIAPSGSLLLATEIFGGGDQVKTDQFNVMTSDHAEYNGQNNRSEDVIEHTTAFSIPNQLVVPAGIRLRLPVSYSSTLGTKEPAISVAELTDCVDLDGNPATHLKNMDQNLDCLTYDPGTYKNGQGYGTVILMGAKEGNSYIRLQDSRTNSYKDIAIQFVNTGDYLDISQQSGIFTFLDEAGREYKSFSADKNGSWKFSNDVVFWGKNMDKPYNGTLTSGKPGAGFRFTTEAETLALYLDGEAIVQSSLPEFKNTVVKNNGGRSLIYFGANPSNKPHVVDVTVTKPGTDGTYADFDRLKEYYYGDKIDLTPWQQDQQISLIWDSHFPAPGSLRPGQAFDATLYAVINSPENKNGGLDYSREMSGAVNLDWTRTSNRHYTWKVRFLRNGTATFKVTDMTGYSVTSQLMVDWWPDNSSVHTDPQNPATEWYKMKYKELDNLQQAGAADSAGDTSSPVENKWMSAEMGEDMKSVTVRIDRDAPEETFDLYVADCDEQLDLAAIMRTGKHYRVDKGSTTTVSVSANQLHMIAAVVDLSDSKDPDLNFSITRENGTVEQYNAEDDYFYNVAIVDNLVEIPDIRPVMPTTGTLSDNHLSYDSVIDGEILYLIKGHKYTLEEGLKIDSVIKGAVKVNEKKHILTAKTGSVVTLTKGDGSKTLIIDVVKIKPRTVTLNSRKTSVSFAELFTGSKLMEPDVKDGVYEVGLIKDDKGILEEFGKVGNDVGAVSLYDIRAIGTGKSGSAKLYATFGGKTYKATVKCGGYPVSDTLSGNLVQHLPEEDEKGNRVLTFDSVSDGDTLLLLKNGKYSLEKGVTLEPLGEEYKNAVKIKEDKKTGIRSLSLKKEAIVRISRTIGEGQVQQKTILLNYVSIKKKTVVLDRLGDVVSLYRLFDGAYELLPDVSGTVGYGGYKIRVTDSKGAVVLDDATFPVEAPEGSITDLSYFLLKHAGNNGNVTVKATFGGKEFKATVKCK